MPIKVKEVFGLEFIGGRSKSVAQRKQNFAPAGLTFTITEREGPSKLCSGATTSATKEFTA